MLIFVEHLTTGGRSTSCVIARIIIIRSSASVKLIDTISAIEAIVAITTF